MSLADEVQATWNGRCRRVEHDASLRGFGLFVDRKGQGKIVAYRGVKSLGHFMPAANCGRDVAQGMKVGSLRWRATSRRRAPGSCYGSFGSRARLVGQHAAEVAGQALWTGGACRYRGSAAARRRLFRIRRRRRFQQWPDLRFCAKRVCAACNSKTVSSTEG
jgi:hypothetical protein